MFFYDGKVLHLGNIKHVKYVDNELIIITFEQFELIIHGQVLKIIQLTEDELYLQGTIEEIGIKYDK